MIIVLRTLLTALLLFVTVACAPMALPDDLTPTPASEQNTPTPIEEVEAIDSAAIDSPAVSSSLSLQRFEIVPAASSVTYRAYEEFFGRAINTHAPYTLPIGRTNQVTGTIAVALSESGLQIEPHEWLVNVRSLTSDDARRDRAIRRNYLNSDAQPLARFIPQEVSGFPTDYREGDVASFDMHGDMTIRATTLPITFNVDAVLSGDVISATAKTQLNMPDFDVYPPRMLNFVVVQDPLDLTVQVQATAVEAMP